MKKMMPLVSQKHQAVRKTQMDFWMRTWKASPISLSENKTLSKMSVWAFLTMSTTIQFVLTWPNAVHHCSKDLPWSNASLFSLSRFWCHFSSCLSTDIATSSLLWWILLLSESSVHCSSIWSSMLRLSRPWASWDISNTSKLPKEVKEAAASTLFSAQCRCSHHSSPR